MRFSFSTMSPIGIDVYRIKLDGSGMQEVALQSLPL